MVAEKRKEAPGTQEARSGGGKRNKNKAQYGVKPPGTKYSIESGDAGIFLSFDMGRDSKCLHEMKDLLQQYANDSNDDDEGNGNGDDDDDDIEAAIQREIAGIKSASVSKTEAFQEVRMEVPCVAFIKTLPPHNPVDLVRRICTDAQNNPAQKRSRWIKRMTPLVQVRKTAAEGCLEELIEEVVKPEFVGEGLKFAIRPFIRYCDKFKREDVIKTIAAAVGPNHKVDLKNYDKLILVDVCRHVIGMSVVGPEFDGLKRFNLSELYSPTPKPEVAPKKLEEEIDQPAIFEETKETESSKIEQASVAQENAEQIDGKTENGAA